MPREEYLRAFLTFHFDAVYLFRLVTVKFGYCRAQVDIEAHELTVMFHEVGDLISGQPSGPILGELHEWVMVCVFRGVQGECLVSSSPRVA